MTSRPELLMPAGDFDKLRFAFAYGADAVYAGVPLYSLRARENGFRAESLAQAIEYTHSLGKRIYLTMNIYAHNSKVDRFLDSFCEMADLEPDGFIMTDLGLIRESSKLRPNAVIHLSTQANLTNWASAAAWRDLGVKRLILSRELSLKEIAEIHHRVPDVELETFVHGAVCIAYSGRCLISNYLNHRDANQGTCTNSCRWDYSLQVDKGSLKQSASEGSEEEEPYQQLAGRYYVTEPNRAENELFELDEDQHGSYLMNSKDLCAIELLSELREAGVCSFKVEGRTKSEYYLATITKAYRSAIDDLEAGRPFNPEHLREVAKTSNRTLMTGFYLKRPKEYGINFEDGWSAPLMERYAAKFLAFEPESRVVWVEVKNRLQTGDSVQWVTPEGEFEKLKLGKLVNKKGEPVEAIHGGTEAGIVLDLKFDAQALSEFSLLRAELNSPLPIMQPSIPSLGEKKVELGN